MSLHFSHNYTKTSHCSYHVGFSKQAFASDEKLATYLPGIAKVLSQSVADPAADWENPARSAKEPPFHI